MFGRCLEGSSVPSILLPFFLLAFLFLYGDETTDVDALQFSPDGRRRTKKGTGPAEGFT